MFPHYIMHWLFSDASWSHKDEMLGISTNKEQIKTQRVWYQHQYKSVKLMEDGGHEMDVAMSR